MLGIWWGEGHSSFISFPYVLNVRSRTREKLLGSPKEKQDVITNRREIRQIVNNISIKFSDSRTRINGDREEDIRLMDE